jgi:transporter family protein
MANWLLYALLSALFAALTAIFAKAGLKDVNSDLATAIRTAIVLFITWQLYFTEIMQVIYRFI